MADLRANERKILSVLQKLSGNASVKQLISEAKLSDAAVMRAALTLQEKNLVKISAKLETIIKLNAEGKLEIHKFYSGELQKPKCKSIEACAIHPTIDGAKDLLQLKNPDLKKRAQELNIDLEDVDQRVNAPIRERIRNHFDGLQLQPSMIPLNEDNAKKIWTELRKFLPAFALFKSDRASTDQDPEAQDPLKTAVKEAIKAKEAELTAITEYVRSEVKKIADLTLEKLREMDPTLAAQLNPTFTPQK